jgi:hypothetical protein
LCSDFPHPNAADRTPIDKIFRESNPTLSTAQQDLVINGNARRMYGLG